MSSQDLPNSQLASDPEEVIKLECPSCSGVLNLRRKHMGIEGNCVHCETPVTAVDSGGGVVLKRSGLEPEVPTIQEGAMEQDAPEAPAMEEVPPELPEEPIPAPDPIAESNWGFPTRDKSDVDVNEAAPPMPDFSILTGKSPEPVAEKETLETDADVQLESPEAFPMPEFSNEGEKSADVDQSPESGFDSPFPEAPDSGILDQPLPTMKDLSSEEEKDSFAPLPENPSLTGSIPDDEGFKSPPSSALFEESSSSTRPSNSADVNDDGEEGTEVELEKESPTQNHASISPFSNDSSSGDLGFAETLFKEDNEEVSCQMEPKSPFSDPVATGGGALFGDSSQPSPAQEDEEPVVLDGDGRPMKPMTEEEKEAFAAEMMQVGDFHKRSPWIRRIRKFFVTLVVLCGIGYAGYVFLPQNIVANWKAKVVDWLEPGSVLMDFLPFELEDDPDGAEGEKRVRIKAIDGFNQLTNEMDAYLDASEQNLRETGAKIPERERNEEMEMPNIPKIPKLPFKLPSGGGAAPAAE